MPLLFEALPTEAGADLDRREFHLDLFRPLRASGISAINVPEIIGGHYETVEPRQFARELQEATGLPSIVNRITVQEPVGQLTKWLTSTQRDHGIDHFVMVGGESSHESYPGPNVPESLAAARRCLPKKSSLGVITIPTRRRPVRDEPERLLVKQKAGADHAISQILGESESAAKLQHDLALAASDEQVAPMPIFWSLAPVSRIKDIGFLKWLGVDIPKTYEQALRDAGSRSHRIEVSHRVNESMVRNLLEHAEVEAHGPIGFCIEHVMRSNMAPAFELIDRVRDVIQEFQSVPLSVAKSQ